MRLYSRTGDKGFTLLPGPEGKRTLRIRKDDVRLEALGAVDELNAAIGLCVVEAERAQNGSIREALQVLQDELFRLGAMLAAIGTGRQAKVRLEEASVGRMESQIDAIWNELGKLEHFIVPGGCALSAQLHLARTIARRAERAVVKALDVSKSSRRGRSPAALVGKYLNRLSDLLFALARKANHNHGIAEPIWKP